jgi:hypothetical protein
MAKKIKIVAILLVLSFFGIAGVLVQSVSAANSSAGNNNDNVEVLATVNIYQAKIASQDNNNLKIDFNLSNREKVQPGVRYEVYLVGSDKDNANLSDKKVYDETLTLNENATIHKEIQYTAPAWLSGSFDVWVISENDKGLPLGQEKAGNIKLNGQAGFIEIDPASCSIKVSGQDQKYSLDQGVNIASSEDLTLTCDVKNNYPNDITVTPSFSTYYRDVFGVLVSSAKQDPISLTSGATKTIDFTLPKASNPQAYDVMLTLLDNQGEAVSNSIDSHYVLDGPSGTIQNLRLDKNSYAQGDTAQALLDWTPAADNFPGARNGGTKMDDASIAITVTSANRSCISPFEKNLSEITSGSYSASIGLLIISDCPNPFVTAVLKDANGNILDKTSFAANSQVSQNAPAQPPVQAKGNTNPFKKIILIVLLLVIILAVLILIKMVWKNKNKNITKIGLFLAIFLGCGLWGQVSHADTIKITNHYGYSISFSVGLDNSSYLPGGTITASGKTATWSGCGNVVVTYTLTAQNDATSSQTILSKKTSCLLSNCFYNGTSASGAVSMTAESTEGTHYVTFTASATSSEGAYGPASAQIPYYVTCAPGTFDPTNCRACDGNGNWSANCTDYGDGSNAQQWCGCDWNICGTHSNAGCCTWTPNPSTVCSGTVFTQTDSSGFCGSQQATGTETCASPTISGYVKKSTGEAIAGATIETCQGLVTTDSSGYWAKTVNTGSGYCARVASLPEAGATSVLTTNNNWCHSTASSYEWQVAGVMVGNCANSDDPVSWDRDRDSDVDFTVTATADAPAPPCTSNGCEANTCVGQTCNNGCVANAPGADNGSCNNGLSICNGQSYTGTCNKTCSGNKDCSWKEVAP